jgi:hypothetical protein
MFTTEGPESKEMSFTLLPKGGYRVVIAKVDLKHKDNNIHSASSWFNIQYDIIPYHGSGDDALAGRKVFCSYTWTNPNAQAVEIGHALLRDVLFCCNVQGVDHPSRFASALEGKELYVYIDIQKRRDRDENENRITSYWSLGGRQRKQNPKPLPPPPTAEDIASAPPLPPKSGARSNSSGGIPDGHPAFDDALF